MKRALVVALLLAPCSCAPEPALMEAATPLSVTDAEPEVEPTAAMLPEIPESVNIGAAEYRFDAYLWRDFMPISPPDGKPLLCSIQVKEVGSKTFAPGVTAEHLWVFHEAEVWSTPFSDEERPSGGNILDKMARGGPNWGPGVNVDVVVALRDVGGRRHLLRRVQQPIDRTD